MKYDSRHFKFVTMSRRFPVKVWTKYYSLKAKKVLTEFDKFWMRQFRAQLKVEKYRLIGTHVPTKTKTEWTIKKNGRINKKEYLQKLVTKVKDKRQKSRSVQAVSKTFDGAAYNVIGNVFSQPGTINPLATHLNTNNPLAMKKPRHKNRNYIGIELEFNTLPGADKGQRQIAANLKAAGLAKYVDVGTDGSCGWEVRVLVLEDEFETVVPKILAVINEMGFPCNDQCGTHVHFDMRNRDVSVVYSNLFKTQKFLRKFLTNKRKKNEYCKMNKADTFEKQFSNGNRYWSLNVQAYQEHRTLEVRMLQGTLDAKVLLPWIKLLLKVVNYKTEVAALVATLKQAKNQFDIDEKLVQNLEERLISLRQVARVAAPDVQPAGNMFTGIIRNWTL